VSFRLSAKAQQTEALSLPLQQVLQDYRTVNPTSLIHRNIAEEEHQAYKHSRHYTDCSRASGVAKESAEAELSA